MDIEGLGEKLALRFLDEGLITDSAGIYDLTAERLAELEGFGEISARNLIARDRGLEAAAVRARPLRARPARASATSPPRRSPSTSASIDAPARGRAPRQITEVEGIGPMLAEQLREELADEAIARSDRAAARARSALRALGGRAPRRGRAARGQDLRPHRHPARAEPRAGDEADPRAPAARSPARSRRRPTTSSPATARARSSPRPRRSAPRSSTRTGCASSSARDGAASAQGDVADQGR